MSTEKSDQYAENTRNLRKSETIQICLIIAAFILFVTGSIYGVSRLTAWETKSRADYLVQVKKEPKFEDLGGGVFRWAAKDIGSLRCPAVLHTFEDDLGAFAKEYPDRQVITTNILQKMYGDKGIPVVALIITEKKRTSD